MKNINQASEEYRKYLLKINFLRQEYYTVFGADLSDNEIDKLLVDNWNKLVLFPTPLKLLSYLRSGTYTFDNLRMEKWAIAVSGIHEPYTEIDLDVLSTRTGSKEDINLFRSIYDTLGIMRDFSDQISDEKLIMLFEEDTLLKFNDELADYFIWSGRKSTPFKLSVDIEVLFSLLNEIFDVLKKKISIQPAG